MSTGITALDAYYAKHPEPMQGCLLALKDIILNSGTGIVHERKFQIPFFSYKGKKLAFLWVHRKKLLLGFVEDKNIYPKAPGEKRKNKMEMMEIDPHADIPVKTIRKELKKLMDKYDRFDKTVK